MIKVLLILVLLTSIAYAGSSVTKNWAMPLPPTADNPTSSYNFLLFLYNHFNQTQIVTTNPNGNYNGKCGNFLLYNNAGSYQFCIEVTQPNGTVWKCTNLS